MDNDDTRRSGADWFNEGIKCFNKPDGVGAVRAFEAVVKIDPAYRHKDWPNALYWGEKTIAEDPDNYRHQELVSEVKKQMK